MHPLVKLVRPVNVVMGFAAVIIGGWAFKDWVLLPELFAAGLAWAMFTAAANMINDALDVPIDKINHPERALAQWLLDPKVVLLCAFFLIMPALYLCAVINIYLLDLGSANMYLSGRSYGSYSIVNYKDIFVSETSRRENLSSPKYCDHCFLLSPVHQCVKAWVSGLHISHTSTFMQILEQLVTRPKLL